MRVKLGFYLGYRVYAETRDTRLFSLHLFLVGFHLKSIYRLLAAGRARQKWFSHW